MLYLKAKICAQHPSVAKGKLKCEFPTWLLPQTPLGLEILVLKAAPLERKTTPRAQAQPQISSRRRRLRRMKSTAAFLLCFFWLFGPKSALTSHRLDLLGPTWAPA